MTLPKVQMEHQSPRSLSLPVSEPVLGSAEPSPEDTPPEMAETPEAEYEIDADIPVGWHNAPVTVTVRIRDKNNAAGRR